MKSLFGGMFDFNHDGELDTFESSMELEFLNELADETDYAGYDLDSCDCE